MELQQCASWEWVTSYKSACIWDKHILCWSHLLHSRDCIQLWQKKPSYVHLFLWFSKNFRFRSVPSSLIDKLILQGRNKQQGLETTLELAHQSKVHDQDQWLPIVHFLSCMWYSSGISISNHLFIHNGPTTLRPGGQPPGSFTLQYLPWRICPCRWYPYHHKQSHNTQAAGEAHMYPVPRDIQALFWS